MMTELCVTYAKTVPVPPAASVTVIVALPTPTGVTENVVPLAETVATVGSAETAVKVV